MANIAVGLKREATVQGYLAWFRSAGLKQDPIVNRYQDGIDIMWRPGQAKIMTAYFTESMKDKSRDPNDLNVSVPWGKVFIPLAVKKGLPWVAGYTLVVVLATKYLWRK